jgi:iron complex outermembrane receptor protein
VGTINRSGYSVARNLFPSTAELPDSYTSIASLTAKLDHRFNDTWSNSTIVRVSQSRFNEPAQSVLSNVPLLPPSTFGTFNVLLKEDTSEVGLNSSMIAKFDAGPTRNRFLVGVDYDTVWDQGFLNGQLAGLVDFAAPGFPAYSVPPAGPFTTFTNIRNRYTQAGLAAQIQTDAWERLHVLAGARLANVNIRSNELTTGGAFTTDQTKLLPRLGIGYDLVPGLMLYGAYNQGLKAVPYFNGPVAPKAQSSEQFELGVKFETQIGLSGTIAAYQLTLDNVPVANPAAPGTQMQTGQQQSRGIEVDVIWQPTRAWSILGSYAYAEAVVTKDSILPVNTWLAQVPRNSGRLWANYTVQDGKAEGLSLGAGMYGASPQAVVVGGPWKTPGYVTFDARVAYPIKSWTLSLVARNLANQRYWVPYSYFDGRVAPGAGRTVYATAAVRF